jgi:hypothetical protein
VSAKFVIACSTDLALSFAPESVASSTVSPSARSFTVVDPSSPPPFAVTHTFRIVTFVFSTVIDPVTLRFWIVCPFELVVIDPELGSDEHALVAPTVCAAGSGRRHAAGLAKQPDTAIEVDDVVEVVDVLVVLEVEVVVGVVVVCVGGTIAPGVSVTVNWLPLLVPNVTVCAFSAFDGGACPVTALI